MPKELLLISLTFDEIRPACLTVKQEDIRFNKTGQNTYHRGTLHRHFQSNSSWFCAFASIPHHEGKAGYDTLDPEVLLFALKFRLYLILFSISLRFWYILKIRSVVENIMSSLQIPLIHHVIEQYTNAIDQHKKQDCLKAAISKENRIC